MWYLSYKEIMEVLARLEEENAAHISSKNFHEKKIALIRRLAYFKTKKRMIEKLKEKYDRS